MTLAGDNESGSVTPTFLMSSALLTGKRIAFTTAPISLSVVFASGGHRRFITDETNLIAVVNICSLKTAYRQGTYISSSDATVQPLRDNRGIRIHSGNAVCKLSATDLKEGKLH